MFTIARKPKSDKVALPRRLLIAPKPVVRKVAHLIVSEIEYCNLLPHSTFLGTISLIEKCGVAAIGTQRNGCGITVGASYEAGHWNLEDSAGGKHEAASILVCRRNSENQTESEASDSECRGRFVHTLNTPRTASQKRP